MSVGTHKHRAKRERHRDTNPVKGAHVCRSGAQQRYVTKTYLPIATKPYDYRIVPHNPKGQQDITRHTYMASFTLAYGEVKSRMALRENPPNWVIQQRSQGGWTQVYSTK